jgi:hypothetical protein
MAQVILRKATVEAAKPDQRFIDMFVAAPRHRVEDADCGQKLQGLAGRGEQLFDGVLVIAGLPEYTFLHDCELIGADDQVSCMAAGNRFGLFAGKPRRLFARRFITFPCLIDVGRHGLIFRQDTVQESAPVV